MKKRIVIIILALVVLLCGLIAVQTWSIHSRVTKHIGQTGISSISFDSDSPDYSAVSNLTDRECIDTVSRFLKEASFRGLLPEKSIIRAAEKHCVRMVLLTADNKWYEIQLTDKSFDECYIRPFTGLYSRRCYIKIGNCQDFYEYVRDYIEAHQTQ